MLIYLIFGFYPNNAMMIINNLKIDNLNRINLFVGDNNCGKTSVMEALQLFRTSELLGNIYTIARQRESIFWMNSNEINVKGNQITRRIQTERGQEQTLM